MYVLQNAKLYVPWLCLFFAWASQKILSHKFASFPSFFGSFIYPWSTFWTQLAIWPDAKLRLNLILSLIHDINCPSLYLPAAMQNRCCLPSDVMVRNSVLWQLVYSTTFFYFQQQIISTATATPIFLSIFSFMFFQIHNSANPIFFPLFFVVFFNYTTDHSQQRPFTMETIHNVDHLQERHHRNTHASSIPTPPQL